METGRDSDYLATRHASGRGREQRPRDFVRPVADGGPVAVVAFRDVDGLGDQPFAQVEIARDDLAAEEMVAAGARGLQQRGQVRGVNGGGGVRRAERPAAE